MKTSLLCKDTLTIRHTGAGTAGAHTTEISMMPGEVAITGGGTAGGATTTIKLKDADGNLFDIPNADASGAAALPGAYLVEFCNPGLTVVIATTGAGASTAQTFTIGRV